jgi:predicted DCC family thiol-disulfide oxidoreductase YuxK
MGPILLFDGHCALCHRSVRWLIAHDSKAQLRFAPQSSKQVTQLLQQLRLPLPTSNSLWLLHQNKLYEYSDAVLYASSFLNAPWRYLALLRFIPKSLRNILYRWVAKNRYRWFGQYPQCPIPAHEHRHRFLFLENESFL